MSEELDIKSEIERLTRVKCDLEKIFSDTENMILKTDEAIENLKKKLSEIKKL